MIRFCSNTLLRIYIAPGIFLGVLFSQIVSESVPVHTYSIFAYDEETIQ